MMDNFANLRIASKLMLLFGLLIVGFGAMLYGTLEKVALLQQSEAQIVKPGYALIADVKQLRMNIQDQRIALLLALAQVTDISQQSALESEVQRLSLTNAQLLAGLRHGLSEDQQGREILEQLQEVRNAYAKSLDEELIPALRSEQTEQTRQLLLDKQAKLASSIHSRGQQLVELTELRVTQTLTQTQVALEQQRKYMMWLGVLLTLASALLTWLFSRHITLPLQRLTDWAEQISRGDIPRQMSSGVRQDEVGRLGLAFTEMGRYLQALADKAAALAQGQLHEQTQDLPESDVLGRAFASMLSNLRGLALELNQGIAVLAASSEEILAVTTQVATSTQETATSISEIATTVAEIKQTAILAGSKSQSVVESNERTRLVAAGGRQALDETLKGMSQIREQMQAVAESIMLLGEQSQTIGEIVASVGALAEQSNLLGVNASIEAVKAGEAGKGFSVVAQEVKTLAEQSKLATAQVRGILSEIQKAMSKAVLQAEQGSKTVENGYQRAEVSGEAIRTLSSSIEESSAVALQIAASSQQQMIGMEQIDNAMESIRLASQNNVASTHQVDLAARNLHQLGLKLTGLAAQFKL